MVNALGIAADFEDAEDFLPNSAIVVMLVAEIGRVRYARCTGSIGRIRQPLIYASGWVKARLEGY